MDLKTCTRCGQDKPLAEFKTPKPRCTDCQREYRAEWLERPGSRDRQRWHRFRTRLAQYGIRPVDYMAMLDAQNGVCAICRCLCKTGRDLSVDHCHTTGVTRGLLCVACNLLVGDYETGRRATSAKHAASVEGYLAKYGAGNPVLGDGVGYGPLPSRKRVAKAKTFNPDWRGKRLTSAMVVEIRARVAAGETRAAIARELGVDKSCIVRAVNGVSWSHVA